MRPPMRSALRLVLFASTTLFVGLVHGAPAGANPDAAALAAADAYIQSGRRGNARVRVAGVAPGTAVRVRLQRHAFHFGINVPGTFNRFLIEGAPPESEAGRFQRFVLDHFNTVVPSNGGKSIYNEGVRDFVTMDYIDLILRWAARNTGCFARMHTLIWDAEQQPHWVRICSPRPRRATRRRRRTLFARSIAGRIVRARPRGRLSETWTS